MADRTITETIQGPVALMVEQGSCKAKVAGSIPGQGLQNVLWVKAHNGGEYIYSRDYGFVAEKIGE